jgi:histidyl-tRNA synthetase
MGEKIEKESYKGVRDFYPEDQAIQDYIFFIWESTLESFGYEKYNASVLEPTSLFRAKSGEEIINEQTYQFTDRGDREVTLRPEMTPTIARMIAKKKRELIFPLRWYSIPNLFRYERPQKGRLREHWQLNADIFGVKNLEAEIEMIEIAATILKNFGLKETQFEIKINDLEALNKTLYESGLSEIDIHVYRKLLDKKQRIDNFDQEVEKVLGNKFELNLKQSDSINIVIEKLKEREITNVVFSPDVVRGFDYYTGVVFEAYSNDPVNNRSILGGGRYDELLKIFNDSEIPAVGFGMGDVTTRDVLETYNLLPKFKPSTQIYLCILNSEYFDTAKYLAQSLRKENINVSIDFSEKKLSDQISKADKKKVPFVICIGENEIKTQKYNVKNMQTGKEKTLPKNKIAKFVKRNLLS